MTWNIINNKQYRYRMSSMYLLCNHKLLRTQTACLFCVILSLMFITSNFVFRRPSSLSLPLHVLLTKINKLCPQKDYVDGVSLFGIPNVLVNLTFSTDRIYHHNGIAYDYYSVTDLRQSKASCQWKIWPLPQEINHNYSLNQIEISPFVMSKLPFVDVIYVMTDPRLIQRHYNLKKAFLHQGISNESIEWRMKWNSTTCNSNSSHSYVYQRLNLKDKPLDKEQQRRCALAMKHADVYHDMAKRKIQLALILEDDAIFVPFFKEKFTRMIYAAMKNGILQINGTCKEKSISDNEWINQNPMIVIGTCFNFHGQDFESHLLNARPMLSTHKSDTSRCSHAYLLTSCSAQGLVDQIHAQKNDFLPSDVMQTYLFRLSTTLQLFWMDPPLAYQGNQVIDLDQLETFKGQTYK